MTNQVEAIQNLTRELPLNDFGLPTGIYRVDLLPFHEYVPPQQYASVHQPLVPQTPLNPINYLEYGNANEEEINPEAKTEEPIQGSPTDATTPVDSPREVDVYRIAGFPAQALHNAFVPLQYYEGFPAFDNGVPFWGQLEFEPADAYEAFQKYLLMPLGIAGNDDDDEYTGRPAGGTRSISALVAGMYRDRDIAQMIQVFTTYYHLFYWGLRAKAHDLFRVAQYRKQQELRAIETHNEHYHQSRKLRHRLMKYMDSEEEFWDLMSPKVAVDMFKQITQLERLSAGVPALGPLLERDQPNRDGQPFEMILRNVAQTNRGTNERSISEDGGVLEMALEDEGATEVLQELIIRTGGSSHGNR